MEYKVNQRCLYLFATDFSDYKVSRNRRDDPDFEELKEIKSLLESEKIPFVFISDVGDPRVEFKNCRYIGLEELRMHLPDIKNYFFQN